MPESPTTTTRIGAGGLGSPFRSQLQKKMEMEKGERRGYNEGFRIPATPPAIASSQTQPESFDCGIGVMSDSGHGQEVLRKSRRASVAIAMQSSQTEPGGSQWTQDPFSEANEAFRRFADFQSEVEGKIPPARADEEREKAPVKMKIQSSDTQSSRTQSDDDDLEVDGLVGLYPPSSRTLQAGKERRMGADNSPPSLPPTASTIEREAVDGMLTRPSSTPACDLAPDRILVPGSPSVSRSPSNEAYTNTPMPDIGSSEDSELIVFTPGRVRRAVHAVRSALDLERSRPRAAQKRKQEDGRQDRDEVEEDWEGVRAVRDFLAMFSPSQSPGSTPILGGSP